MRVVDGDAGYGAVTKFLHWLTVAALLVQFVLGYALEGLSEWVTDSDSSGHGGGGDADDALIFVHAGVGVAILVLATVRLLWRVTTPFPPWSERLSERDRRLAHRTEQVLYAVLFVIPSTGLALLFVSGEEREIGDGNEWQPPFDVIDDDLLLAAHVTSHILFYLALAVHIGLALRRGTIRRII